MRTRRLAQGLFLLFTFSLIFMQPALEVAGLKVIAADGIYLFLVMAWALALASGAARLRWHPFFWLLILYFAAMAISAIFSPDRAVSLPKLAGEAYLLSLPVIACSLVETERDLERAISAWLLATALICLMSLAALALFLAEPVHPLLDIALFGFGSLPEGNYPRLRLSFANANMLCHYLSIGLMMVLLARHRGWMGTASFRLILAGILITAAFTISPGLGAIGLGLGCWVWAVNRRANPILARLSLGLGAAIAILFLAATLIAPEMHGTAPFVVHMPLIDQAIAPSGRVMTWLDAARTFFEQPFTGKGLGTGAVSVFYLAPSGERQHLTDAHNLFLNVAAESGVLGLVALLLIAATLLRATLPLSLKKPADASREALGIALIGAFVYQGLAGSFEDARHLWLLVGLFLAAGRIGAIGVRN